MHIAVLEAAGMHGKALNVSLWTTQILICISLCIGGAMKSLMPVEKLSTIFAWTGQVSRRFLRFIGIVDFAGGVGIILPALLHIYPGLVVWAALGGLLLQLCAIVFHIRRSELKETPFNFFMLALSAFVLWGRW